jgi:hypothetical protein
MVAPLSIPYAEQEWRCGVCGCRRQDLSPLENSPSLADLYEAPCDRHYRGIAAALGLESVVRGFMNEHLNCHEEQRSPRVDEAFRP